MSTAEAPRERPGRPARSAPSFGLPGAWWPVAGGADVTSQPRSFRLGTRALAVYRDATDAVRAVDDRCPHRRMPLSMGWVTGDGYLQCAYHGWCFDGATGQCAAIPNLAPDERVSPSIRVAAFRTAETENLPADAALTQFDTLLADGLVHVWTGEPGAAAAAAAGARPASTPTGDPIRGEVEIRSPHQRVAEALVWNPGAALGLGLLLGGGDETISPEVDSDEASVTVTRERLTVGVRRASTFDPVVASATTARITTLATTGLTRVEAESEKSRLLARVVIGLTPIGAYRTIVRWHGAVRGPGGPLVPVGSRALTAARKLTGRDVASLERVADLVEEAVDPAVDRLRTLRGA